MNTAQFWTDAEESTLITLANVGASLPQLAEALPGRSVLAIRKRRSNITKRPRHKPTRAAAPLTRRIEALEATIAAAMTRGDWDYVDALLQGHEYLCWKVRQ